MLKYKSFLRPEVFGLDISEASVKIFLDNKLIRAPNKGNLKQSLKQALKQAKIKNQKAVASIPEKYSFVWLKENNKNIEKSVSENIPLPLDKIYYNYQSTEAGILIVAAIKKVVDEYAQMIEGAGVSIQALEPEALATARALRPDKGTILIVDMGLQGASFIICSNSTIYFTAFRSNNDLMLIEQIQEYIDFFKKEINQIILCGGKSKEIGLDKEIEQKIKIKTIKAEQPLFVTAKGLSLRKDD